MYIILYNIIYNIIYPWCIDTYRQCVYIYIFTYNIIYALDVLDVLYQNICCAYDNLLTCLANQIFIDTKMVVHIWFECC